MSKSVKILLDDNGDITIEWGGDLEGVCCGPDEKRLKDKLSKLGIDLEIKSIQCHLPSADKQSAQSVGICVQMRPDYV